MISEQEQRRRGTTPPPESIQERRPPSPSVATDISVGSERGVEAVKHRVACRDALDGVSIAIAQASAAAGRPPPPADQNLSVVVQELEWQVAAARAGHVVSSRRLEAAMSGRRQQRGMSPPQPVDASVKTPDLLLPSETDSLPPPFNTSHNPDFPGLASPASDQAPLPMTTAASDATMVFAARALAAATAERSSGAVVAGKGLMDLDQAVAPVAPAYRSPPPLRSLPAAKPASMHMRCELRALATAQLSKLDALLKQGVLSNDEYQKATLRVHRKYATVEMTP
eukprot:Hpha_TRINITY_DN14896_c0_g1::TRINITY_DN14896_c0_g1_i1::g.170123::m.170123